MTVLVRELKSQISDRILEYQSLMDEIESSLEVLHLKAAELSGQTSTQVDIERNTSLLGHEGVEVAREATTRSKSQEPTFHRPSSCLKKSTVETVSRKTREERGAP